MADVAPSVQIEAGSASLFSPLARAQYRALTIMRWRMIRNGLRSIHGLLDLGAAGISLMIYSFLGLGLGLGAAFTAYLLTTHEELRSLPILFWVLLFIWQSVPIMLASFQEQFDLGLLLRFPVSFPSYFLLYLGFGITEASTVLGFLCCLGIWIGIAFANPHMLPWTTLGLAGFAVFNIVLARAIFVWIDRWLSQRKTREIIGAVIMVVVLGLQLLNPAIYHRRSPRPSSSSQLAQTSRMSDAERRQVFEQKKSDLQVRYEPLIKKAEAVQRWLPPGLAALAIQSGSRGIMAADLLNLGLLGFYGFAGAGVLAWRLRAEYRGENLNQAPGRKLAPAAPKKISSAASVDRSREDRMPDLVGPLTAVIEKEIRALTRTLPYIYAMGGPLLLVVVFSSVFMRGSGPQGIVFPLAVPVCMVYGQLGFTQLLYNNLGAEGAGIRLYFLSPTPIKTVLMAKNLFHAVLFIIVSLTAGLLASLRLGVPDFPVIAASISWLLFSLPVNLAVGNIFSIKMAYRVNPGRLSRQPGSQSNALLSLLIQLSILAVSSAVFWPCVFFNRVWVAVPIFLMLAAWSVLVWVRVLARADALASDCRDELIATLAKTG